MGYKSIVFLIVMVALFVGEAQGEVVFVEKDNFPYQLERTATDIDANDYNCDYDFDSVMVSTPNKIYFIMQDGRANTGYVFYAPENYNIRALEFFVTEKDGLGRGGCRAIAGALNGKLYYFLNRREAFYNIGSSGYNIWIKEVTADQVTAVGKLDLDGDNNYDHILFGTGGFAGSQAGSLYKVILGADHTTYLNSTLIDAPGATVTKISSVDLRGDGISDEIVYAYSSTVKIINSNGTEKWSLTMAHAVNDILPADLDRDGALDDLIISHGDTVTALNSDKSKKWEKNFTANVTSLSHVDIDKDSLLDYVIAAVGKKLVGLNAMGDKIFEFETPATIKKHVSLDFDGDDIFDDIAFISGDKVYAYDYSERDVPVLDLELTASPANITFDEKSSIDFSVTNVGKATAINTEITCIVPQSLGLGEGERSFRGSISKSLSKELSFNVTGILAGNHTLKCTIEYYDSFGKPYSSSINAIILVTGKEETNASEGNGVEVVEPEEPSGTPLLVIQRTFTNSLGLMEGNQTISEGENISVDIMIRNQGDGVAMNVILIETLPEGFELEDGSITFNGKVEPGRLEIISYSARAQETTNESYIYPVVNVTYQDSSGNPYESSIDSVEIFKIESSLFPGLIGILAIGIFLILIIVVILKKKGKLPGKIDNILNKIKLPPALLKIGSMLPKKGEMTLSEEDKAFLKLYKKYQEKGKRPSYGEVSEELGIEIDKVERIVKKLKKRIKKSK